MPIHPLTRKTFYHSSFATDEEKEDKLILNVCAILLLHNLYPAGLRFVDGRKTWYRASGWGDAQSTADEKDVLPTRPLRWTKGRRKK